MSWAEVNFALIRHSPVEGPYFYDLNYPTSIQFYVNGRWEPWDVSWVKHKSQDPDIKRIAEDAEARLVRDQTSGYRPWPSTPPATPTADQQAPIQGLGDSPLFLPSPSSSEFPSPTAENYARGHIQAPGPPSTQPYGYTAPFYPSNAAATYASPYGPEPTPPSAGPSRSVPPLPAAGPPRSAPPPAASSPRGAPPPSSAGPSRSAPRSSVPTEASPLPTVDPAKDPARDPASDPASDSAIDPAVDLAIDPIVDPALDPAIDPALEPALINGEHQQPRTSTAPNAQAHPTAISPEQQRAPPPPPPPPPPLGYTLHPTAIPPEQQRAPTPLDYRPHPAAAPPVLLPRNRETKILLSLDGDGIRGLSQVLLIESLVNAICQKLGGPVEPYKIFDLIGGTSLGGITAIMLSRLRMQAHRAREAYKTIAKEVFWNKRDFFTSFAPFEPTRTYDGQAVENAVKEVVLDETGNLEELLYDSRDDSADVFVVSTRIDIGTNKAALMRSYQTRRITGPELDANMTIWEAMKATVVAPRYMQPRTGVNWRPVIEPGLVDHGTAKNNPIRDILYECRKLFRYTNDMMVIVSIGTGSGLDWTRELAEMGKSVGDRTTEASVWGEKFEAEHQALMERGWMKYFRLNVPDLNDVPLEEWNCEDLLREKTLAYLARPEIGHMFYACVDAITTVLVGAPRNMGV